MNSLGGLRKHLLLALVGASACAPRKSVEHEPIPGPQVRHEPESERTVGESQFATPTGDGQEPASCQHELTRYCFAPFELQKILASCGPPKKPEDGHGCLTREGYASCGASVVSGPNFDNGQCCYQVCQQPALPGGRPLRVAEGYRRSAAEKRDDWTGLPASTADSIDDATRAALALAWTEDGLTEHASIASFARFTLELLAVGAPPEFLSEAQRGGRDEVEHAQLCFALAARFGGVPCGPGPLALSGVSPRETLRDIVLATVSEGCVAETIGASLASEQLARCTDDATRRVLHRIARDEADHAALAWRFVAWALGIAPELAAEVERAAQTALREWAAPRDERYEMDEALWHRFGRLGAGEIAALARRTAHEVIRPCLDQLRSLGSAPRQARPLEQHEGPQAALPGRG
ncbi:MAG: ferritin-like domain-containing protein [Polyangiaceae bacterium]